MSDDQEYTVQTARAAADAGELGRWVRRFLGSPGSDNAELGELLEREIQDWTGPLRLPLRRLHRLAGPPGSPVLCPVDEEYWDDRVDDMAERLEDEDDDWGPPPLIVAYRDGRLVLEDGNHRVESLRRAGRREAWSVVGFEDAAGRERFERDLSPEAGARTGDQA